MGGHCYSDAMVQNRQTSPCIGVCLVIRSTVLRSIPQALPLEFTTGTVSCITTKHLKGVVYLYCITPVKPSTYSDMCGVGAPQRLLTAFTNVHSLWISFQPLSQRLACLVKSSKYGMVCKTEKKEEVRGYCTLLPCDSLV